MPREISVEWAYLGPGPSAMHDETARERGEITQLLESWRLGDDHAFDEALELVYQELRDVASAYLHRERSGHTLQTTALVHEAYLKLSGGQPLRFNDRKHFFRIAARAMRRILVDHARRQSSKKRIGPDQKVSLEEVGEPVRDAGEVIAVHEALELLGEINPRQAQLVELRYFVGLSTEEAAEVLGVSLSTLARDWRVAKHWLYSKLHGD